MTDSGDRDILPWKSHAGLKALAGDLAERLTGGRIDGLAGGPGWLRLTFPPDGDRDLLHLYMSARPGAVLCWDAPKVWPGAFDRALGRVRQKDLTVTPYLMDAELTCVDSPADERIMRFSFRSGRDGTPLTLAMQLFGQRGNIVLADAKGRRIWSAHGSPHPQLLEPAGAGRPAPFDPTGSNAASICRTEGPVLLETALARDLHARLTGAVGRALITARKLVANLGADLARADRGDLDRRHGETLAMHLHALSGKAEQVVLTAADGETLTIPLDPALTPAENMDRFFKRARRSERGRETVVARLAEAESRQADLETRASELADLSDAPELRDLLDWRDANDELLTRHAKSAPAGRRAAPGAPRPFRRYVVDGKWPVWVGRNNAENDELTHRASSPDDIWMHAQGVPGSHVILRTGGKPEQVPRTVLLKAAALAALHSRARNSEFVPVMHTLRKYVRKPRKSPPGAALPEREKSVMVGPRIVSGVAEETD